MAFYSIINEEKRTFFTFLGKICALVSKIEDYVTYLKAQYFKTPYFCIGLRSFGQWSFTNNEFFVLINNYFLNFLIKTTNYHEETIYFSSCGSWLVVS